ncbi:MULTISPECIES: hypothetical protein [Aerosakkonema]
MVCAIPQFTEYNLAQALSDDRYFHGEKHDRSAVCLAMQQSAYTSSEL